MTNRNLEAQKQIRLMNEGDFTEAIRLARASLVHPFIGDTYSFNSSGILINVGNSEADEALIRFGMQIAECFIASSGTQLEYVIRARYNLSNGYAALAFVCDRNGDHEGRLADWKLQRDELQKLILDRKSIPLDLVTEVLTNFGNVLEELGRTIEAIDIWNQVLAINPDHPVALGSLGQAYMRLINVQPRHNVRLIEAARDSLEHAVSSPDLVAQHAECGALQRYERSLEEVRLAGIQQAGQFHEFLVRIHLLRTQHEDCKPDRTLREWAESGLLLTVNPYPEWCPDTLKDELFFNGIATEASDQGKRRFTELAHTLNQIKEDYALARFLHHASSQPTNIVGVSSVTQFADTLDYADFGLASGMLKASIRISVDIFDKIANFLNRYLELGIPDRKVSFASGWYEKGDLNKKVESPVLARLLPMSGWLRGIKDVAENLNFYPAPSNDARNKAAHDYLIIENSVRPEIRLHGKLVSVDAYEYGRLLLMITKGAIVNLVALVQSQKRLRRSQSLTPRIPMEFRFANGISDELHS